MQVRGSVSKIRYQNKDNGWTVFVLSTEDGDLTCVGTLFTLMEGEDLVLDGDLVFHDKYGEQLKVTKAQRQEPTGEDQLIKYLSSDAIPHIGPKRAKKLLEMYGTDVIRIIMEDEGALTSLKGIGKTKAKEIQEALRKLDDARDTMIFLQSLDIGPARAAEIYKVYGCQSRSIIEENPYRLVRDVDGIGFRTADKLAASLGIREDSPMRTKAGLIYIFNQAAQNDGASFLTDEELKKAVSSLLGGESENLDEVIFDLVIDGYIVSDRENGRYYLQIMDYREREVAMRLSNMQEDRAGILDIDTEEMEKKLAIKLSDEQRQALIKASENKILIITGGPGTGKTSLIRAILEMFDQNGLETELAAPTGRAAKRMEEQAHKEAQTIHRLLAFRGGDEISKMTPGRNEENPLTADALIVDELSMVDLGLMYYLLRALPMTSRLVLVGDADQLPSVGPGNVLHDLIASNVLPTVRLEKIFRQSEGGNIVLNAHRIRRGLPPLLNEEGSDFFFLQSNSSRETADIIEDLICRRLPNHYDFSPLEDIQVLSPMKRGEAGIKILNQRLQRALNPKADYKEEIKIGDNLFREGDRVMQVRNNYDLEWEDENNFEKGQGVYNGDFGIIREIDPEEEIITVDFEGRLVSYSPKELRDLDHSFAITVHKSQGSEFPCIVMAIVPGAPLLMTRSILYTGISRAKKLCVLVGNPKVLSHMVESKQMKNRNSSLDERLKKAMEDPFSIMGIGPGDEELGPAIGPDEEDFGPAGEYFDEDF